MMSVHALAARASGGRRSLMPLDAATAYLRLRFEMLLPWYALAALPTALCGLFVVDALTARDARHAGILALGLAGATLWRWVFTAQIQVRVMRDLGMVTAPFWRRLPMVLALRLCAFTLMTWGGFFIVPPFHGTLLALMNGPLALDADARPWPATRQALRWMHANFKYLSRFLMFAFLVLCMFAACVFGLQALAMQTLPALLGVETQDLALTLESSGWIMAVLLFVGAAADLFLCVAGVFLHHDLRARHQGADLLARLRATDGDGQEAAA